MRIHIVQKGDTLWKIAQKYGVDFNQLKSLNSHLSNPDEIMPGMKIKVPTHSGSVKKEAPMKEMPMKEMPVKEKPMTKHPFVQMKPPTYPVVHHHHKAEKPKEVIKEVPKPIYIPKPQPIVPEIDINNYYQVNMAKMNIEQQIPVQQPKELPIVEKEQPIKELPVTPELPELPKMEAPMVECPEQEQPQMMMPPMMPCHPCVPMTPVLPGSGIPCMSISPICYPCQYPYMYGYPYAGQHMLHGYGSLPMMSPLPIATFQPMTNLTMTPDMFQYPMQQPLGTNPVMQSEDPNLLMTGYPMGGGMQQGMPTQFMGDGMQPAMSSQLMEDDVVVPTVPEQFVTPQIPTDEENLTTTNLPPNPYQMPMPMNMMPTTMPTTFPMQSNVPMTQSFPSPMMQQPYPMMQGMPTQSDDCGCGGPSFELPQANPMMTMGTAYPQYSNPTFMGDGTVSTFPRDEYGSVMHDVGGMYPQSGSLPQAMYPQTAPMGMFPGNMPEQMSYNQGDMEYYQREEFDEDEE
ncbi:SafA/ExsA family spore coat assembly protein [Bacillus andreraoultii]|uniref:SafA/ExsA family spore coat assembly protein n=1 Tax=Bacillus andreraoultii TaxID=1499685 RepID=UPI00067F155A|nr:SafA/ExsA family spore coat assembly protein [Bacillus andreraoultii]